MKKNILATLSITAFFAASIVAITTLTESGTTSVYANTGGSPGGRTGSPNDNANAPFGPGNCTACHSGTINSGSGIASIVSNIPAEGYVPGDTYTITAGIAQAAINKFGFEVSAEKDADNSKVGTFALTDAVKTKFVNSNTAVSHTAAGTTPSTTNATSWSFDWTAPVAGTGDVTFYGAFNSANGSGSGGDQIYTETLAVSEDLSTGLSEVAGTSSLNVYPNPVKNSFEISSDRIIEHVNVFNMQGKQVLNLTQTLNKVNMEGLPSGMYFVNARVDGKTITKKIIKE